MATGFKLADGRDLSDIFIAGDAGLTVGFLTPNGVDLGRQFMGGSTGIVTGYKDYSGIDLGSRFGNDPWIAQGYTPCTMLVGSSSFLANDGAEPPTYWTGYRYGFFHDLFGGGREWYGALSDNSLIGTDRYNSCIEAEYSDRNGNHFFVYAASRGSKRTSVVINGVSYPINKGGVSSNAEAAYNYLKAHAGQNITIYLK